MSLKKLLDNPLFWEFSRSSFESVLSLYKRRIKLMNDWDLLSANPTILDVGCGTGHYAHITGGEYLGIDLNERYIDYAVKKNGSNTRRFEVMNVTDLYEQDKKFDIVLMVDFLHHITDGQCERLLTTLSKITTRHIVSFEPVADQTNALGRWLIRSDRGKNMRSVKDLHQLFHQADLNIVKENVLQHGMVYKSAGFLCAPTKKGRNQGHPASNS